MFELRGNESSKIFDPFLNLAVNATETADNITLQPAIPGVMTGGAAPALSNIESVGKNSADSFILGEMMGPVSQISGDNSVGDVFTGAPSQVVEKALDSAKDILKGLSVDANLTDKLNLAFGENWNPKVATDLIGEFAAGDFSKLPEIDILSGATMNSANGAFAAATDKIYLSQDFVAQNAGNVDAIKSVILEEAGHFIDSRINTKDAAGDEGAIFSGVVQGKTFDAADLANLKAEDDSATINLSGRDISIEMSQIAMASLNGRLYQSHRGYDNNIYTRSSTDGISWTNWNNNGGGSTLNAPSLAAFNGRLYQSHRGSDNNIYTRSSTDGVNWSAWAQSGGTTQSAPTLAAVNGKLYQSHRGSDNNIYTRSSTNGVNWSGWMQAGGSTPTAPALAGYNSRLYQTHRGFDANKMYTRSSTDGMNWTGWSESGGSTPSYPTIAEFNGRLYQAHRGYDSNLIYTRSSTDGANWTGWTSINRSTPTAPSMTAFNGRLYLTHQGLDDKIYMSSSTDGINWGSWIERGGATPTDSDNSPISSIDNSINQYFSDITGWQNKSLVEKWDRIGGSSAQYGQYANYALGDTWVKTMPSEILKVYENLSKAILGKTPLVNTGYAYDEGYYPGYGAHSGIDIQTEYRKPLYSATKGVVVFSQDYANGYGKWIAINEITGDGQLTGRRWWYGHLDPDVVVSVGKPVEPGQQIGVTGNGQGYKTHLHLTVVNTYGPNPTTWNEAVNGTGQGYNADVAKVLSQTVSPLHAYWKSTNGIKE